MRSCILIHFKCCKKMLILSFLLQIFFHSEETSRLQCTLRGIYKSFELSCFTDKSDPSAEIWKILNPSSLPQFAVMFFQISTAVALPVFAVWKPPSPIPRTVPSGRTLKTFHFIFAKHKVKYSHLLSVISNLCHYN